MFKTYCVIQDEMSYKSSSVEVIEDDRTFNVSIDEGGIKHSYDLTIYEIKDMHNITRKASGETTKRKKALDPKNCVQIWKELECAIPECSWTIQSDLLISPDPFFRITIPKNIFRKMNC